MPDVVDEKVYVADPSVRVCDEFTVVPSTTMDIVPVGVDVTVLLAEETVIVMTSLAPELGEAVAAARLVAELTFDEVLEGVGQAEKRL